MLSFYLLGVLLSNHLLTRWQIASIGPPIIRVKPRYPKWLQQFSHLQKHGILSVTEHISEDFSRVVVNRMPKPAWVFLAADITPHLINLGTFNPLNINDNVGRIPAIPGQNSKDKIERWF